jgi:hypothetical protein
VQSKNLFLILVLFLTKNLLFGQDSVQVRQLPAKYLKDVSAKANSLQQNIDRSSNKTLEQMMKQEVKIKRKLARIDSLKATKVFGNVEQRYNELKQHLKGKIPFKQYIPSLDSLSTSLKFVGQNQQLLSQVKDGQQKLNDALSNINGLQDKFQQAEEIKKFLKEQRQYLQDQLSNLGFAKELKAINKQVYYYSEQLKEYKALLSDHKKAERKALELLSKTKLFTDFMRKNSILASLFRLPGKPNDPLSQAGIVGLQTRAQVNSLIQQQIATGGPNAQAQFQQNMQSAQSQINQLKNNISQSGGRSSDDIMPQGFKPNNQRTKSFWNRLEYGTNFQSQKATNLFPVTSDIGLSVGYKLNDKSVIGIGTSYKLGWGQNWNHINISNQGVGLRSFIDCKLKGSFWFTGGFEINYKTDFDNFSQLRSLTAWQQSGLLGLSKVISFKTKFFKKTKLQLLWDYLSYEQVPRTQAILFRVGYNF